MEFIKICMQCGNEFETDKLFNNTLICNKCGSGDISQPQEIDYYNLSLEECFINYYENKIACECDGDKKEVIFSKE